MSKWKNIEDAPQDGRLVIGYDPNYWDDVHIENLKDNPHARSEVGECRWTGLGDRWVLSRRPEADFNPTRFQAMPKLPDTDDTGWTNTKNEMVGLYDL